MDNETNTADPSAELRLALFHYPSPTSGARSTTADLEFRAFESTVQELATVTVLARSEGSGESLPLEQQLTAEISTLAKGAALVFFWLADVPGCWADLKVISSIVDRNSLVLILADARTGYTQIADTASRILGCSFPVPVGPGPKGIQLRAAVYFKDGQPQIQATTRTEVNLAKLAGPPSARTLTKWLLYPAVARNGLKWRDEPQFASRRWVIRAYLPLLVIILAVSAFLGARQLEDPKVRLVRQKWSDIKWDVADGRLLDELADDARLDDSTALTLAGVKQKMLATADVKTCRSLVAGSATARDKLLAGLPEEDIDNYFWAVRKTLDPLATAAPPDADAAELLVAGVEITPSLSSADQSRYASVLDNLANASADDVCWLMRVFYGRLDMFSDREKIAVARTFKF